MKESLDRQDALKLDLGRDPKVVEALRAEKALFQTAYEDFEKAGDAYVEALRGSK